MMKTFNSLLISFSLFALLSVACKEPDGDKPKPSGFTNAIITGEDYRKCACCGGLMITFSNDPKPYSADFSLIDQMPPNSGIDQNSEFPIYVRVKYKSMPSNCGSHVAITAIEKR